jgi:hypothetical protein
MRYDFLTPHQFHPMRSYFDSSLLLAAQPLSLDIAVPQAASRWIGEEIARRIQNRFLGRMSFCDIGFGALLHGALLNGNGENFFETMVLTYVPHPVLYGIVLTDRQSTRPFSTIRGGSSVWLLVDWWKWIQTKVPADRMSDVWMYLCLACPIYWNSAERKGLGIQESLSESMQGEGKRLLEVIVTDICTKITELWAANSDNAAKTQSE